MSEAVSQQPRVLIAALELVNDIDKAIESAKKLEQVAYDDGELGFYYIAARIRDELKASREALTKLIESRLGYSEG